MKILSFRTLFFHKDERRTDGKTDTQTVYRGAADMTQPIVVFRNFVNATYIVALFNAFCIYIYINNFINEKLH